MNTEYEKLLYTSGVNQGHGAAMVVACNDISTIISSISDDPEIQMDIVKSALSRLVATYGAASDTNERQSLEHRAKAALLRPPMKSQFRKRLKRAIIAALDVMARED
jgi:hypothetical protein